VHPVPQIE